MALPGPPPPPPPGRYYDSHVCIHINPQFYQEFIISGIFRREIDVWTFGDHPVVWTEANDSIVRIPVVYCLCSYHHSNVFHNTRRVHTQFERSYPYQTGYHVFVWRDCLHSILTYNSQGNPHYLSDQLVPISCIFPILRNTNRNNRLCIGLVFGPDLTQGERDFESRTDVTVNRGGVFNITETIFGPNLWQTMRTGFQNQRMVAIYVCAGARLLVEDGRTAATGWEGYGHDYDRTHSYFQQGSLFIYEGIVNFKIPNVRGPGGHSQVIEDALYERNHTLFPQNVSLSLNLMAQRYNYTKQNAKYVIFLGRHHSCLESSCWKVDVSHDHAALYVPDAGHILAIESWERGLDEVYARHRYERLFDAVVSSQQGVPISQMPFQIPEMAMIQKILGSDQYYGDQPGRRDFVVNLHDYLDHFVRFRLNFGGGIIERTRLRYDVPLPINTPPLYIPILSGGQLEHSYPNQLKYPWHITHQNQLWVYKIGQEYYNLEQKSIQEYLWKHPVEWYKFKHQMKTGQVQFDPFWHRLGVDSRVYTKSQEKIGESVTYYFRRINENDFMNTLNQ